MNDAGLILRALEFAARRHRKQFRKGEDKSPYINHPIQVASLLANEGGVSDPVLLAGAILHDVIEDTVDSEEEKNELINEISELFGDEILSLTLEVTDDKNLRKVERKRIQIEDAPTKSDNAKKLKIADKILNVRDITSDPPVGWHIDRILEYFSWAEKVVDGMRGIHPRLEKLFDEAVAEGRRKYIG
ncbi:MAG TPA: HD domain-containing protein [Bacteroidales bacterium]|jgi:guanosine-3',5'-bis(diphosphate) 3'-pyrophosphohydrolase|nr:HD domain-containing protein [Bacteroidales bacterium]